MKRKLRFTIRVIFLFTTLVSVLLAFYASRLRARKTALQTVTSLGGVYSASTTSGSEWLRRLLDDDEYFREIETITLGPNTVNSDVTRPIGDAELRQALSSIPDPDGLTGLSLYASLVTDDGLSCMSILPNLESLTLRKTLITDAGIQRFGHCEGLRHLDLAETTVSDRGLPSLVRLQRLERLDLGHTLVSDRGLEHLADLKSLRRLDLRRTQFLGGGFLFLAELPNLEELTLDDTEFGTKGIAARYLQRYANKMTALRVLSLEDTLISDTDLQYLQRCPALEELILDGTGVTDDGLSYLKVMTGLKKVSLKKTEVTKAGIAQLQSMLPSCSISTE